MGTVQSTEKCSTQVEDGSCFAVNNIDAIERSLGPFPIQDIISSLMAPKGISNQFTDILFFQSLIAIGWILAGTQFINYLKKGKSFKQEVPKHRQKPGPYHKI